MSERKNKEEVRVNGYTKEEVVNSFTEVFEGLTGLARENYLSSLKFSLSIWKESMRLAADAQVSQFFAIQKMYAEQAKGAFERFTEQTASFWNGIFSRAFDGNFDRLTSAQKDYINLVRGATEKVTKEAVNLTEKTAEKAFSASKKHPRKSKSKSAS